MTKLARSNPDLEQGGPGLCGLCKCGCFDRQQHRHSRIVLEDLLGGNAESGRGGDVRLPARFFCFLPGWAQRGHTRDCKDSDQPCHDPGNPELTASVAGFDVADLAKWPFEYRCRDLLNR
ncbi:MAG: hypothetical protein AAGA65_20725 [Actinomycetota bacterium]